MPKWWLARWVSCDPAGTVDGPNLYQYVKSNPINGTDATGLAEGEDGQEAAQPAQPVQADRYGREKGFLGYLFRFFGFQKAERLETEALLTDEGAEKFYEARDVRAKGVDAAGEIGVQTADAVMLAMPGPQGGEAEVEVGAKKLASREPSPESGLVATVEDVVKVSEKAVEKPVETAAKKWEDFLPQAREVVKGKAAEYSNTEAYAYLKGQWHHLCTDKGRHGWKEMFGEMFERAGLSLRRDKNNLMLLKGHKGNHPEAYHMYIWLRLQVATAGKRGGAYAKALIRELNYIKRDLGNNPDIVHHDFWKKAIWGAATAK